MRAKDIKINEYYKLKSSPNYSWVKPLQVLQPKEKENTKPYIIVKCEHVVNKDDTIGFIRYFKPIDIIK